MSYAFVTTTADFVQPKGEDIGYFRIKITKNGDIIGVFGGPEFFQIHGWVMWMGWTLLGLVQIISNRYLKHHWYLNMWLHRITGTLIMVSTIIMAAIAVQKKGRLGKDKHLVLGTIFLILTAPVAFLGFAVRSCNSRLRWKTKRVLVTKHLHKVKTE